MKQDDKDINQFFKGLTEADKAIQVPSFNSLYPQKYWLTHWSINTNRIITAASVLFIVGITLLWKQNLQPSEPEVIIITLEKQGTSDTQTLIEVESTMESWTSPTNSLISDF